MRQGRQRLQVSTFPFLAVLLCAMGSLILLLLVIDRRAKIVARAKAMRAMEQALAQATAEEGRAAAAHRAEWERRRQMLHERLLQEDQQVLGELQAVQSKATAATGDLQTELANTHQLKEQLQAERSELARLEHELTARRADLASTAQQADTSRADLARLTADVEGMERTLADLKAARQRRQQMYSLVPYRSKRGDNRKPIYIECAGDDLIFHPDHLALHGLTLTPSGIRDEIEHRMARQRSETKAVHDSLGENSYLLMLIRPNGITTYYHTLAALKGLPIDFGYEFIDQDWILDFSEDDDTPKKQPWMATANRTKKASGPFVKKVEELGTSITGRTQTRQGLPSAGTVPPFSPPSPPAGWGEGRVRGGRPVGILATGSGQLDNPSSGSGGAGVSREGNFGAVTVGNPGAGVPSGAVQSGVARRVVGTGDGNGASFAELLASGSHSVASSETAPSGNVIMARRPPRGQGQSSFAPGGAAAGIDIGQSVAGGQADKKDQPSNSRAVQGNREAQPQMEGSPGNSGKPGMEAPPSLLPPSGSNRADATANPGMDASQGPVEHGAQSAERGAQSAEPPMEFRASRSALRAPHSDEPARGPAGDALDRLAAQNPQRKPVRAVPLRPGLLTGNRDWIIPIECTADALVLHPSGQRIATAELSKGENGNNPLLDTVQRLITRRQATVRPGEPSYRPMIRFRVWPDGLRSYYVAYPALESLHVPMSRENLDPEEEKAASRPR